MRLALKKQLRQFLWRNPITRFYLRGWIGVHKEGIPPGSEFLLRLLVCLKETDFTPVPLLVVCPDLPALIHPYDDLHRLSPCTHVPSPLLNPSPCLLPSAKVIAYIWGHLVLGSCHPRGLADFFSLFTSSCLSLYLYNNGEYIVFSVIVVGLIVASCTEMASGGAPLDRLESLYSTQRGSVAHKYF